ncbi:DUF4288 domain-containing protein [Pseudemcibacter aquimaris]|uniref:DUF4288 domain-containing protein n=1 Tax=Pseudemcibacter aquimaris TaxID=2857064 RepID=UPI0020131716|nr:DUF4288 domain-containing protein [Pseudemcibacter aquimaris]MCC3859983.1 DUF4288 domain-containing protein [Pseudemcibacter aquimaris]WDU57315.1 DUF4288 domain-containing protein [Pseudemcibacter aquimaris]
MTNYNDKEWYSVKIELICNVSNKNTDDETLYEESTRIYKADSEVQAKIIAEKDIRENICEYKNPDGDNVSWEFIKILDVQALYEKEIFEGMEVYSHLRWGVALKQGSSL